MSSFAPFTQTADATRYMVHRLNIPDEVSLTSNPDIKGLTGSKSGIAIINSEKHEVLVPPSSSAEADFWVFGNKSDGNPQVLVTHNNPQLDKIDLYPTLEQFAAAWKVKRDTEVGLRAPHGLILANIKTHGGEESLLTRFAELGIPTQEVVLLDQEYPATDRIMRERKFGDVAPLALRVSRIESMESILVALQQAERLSSPFAIFYDPVGQEDKTVPWPFEHRLVSEMYRMAPRIEFVLCCPSRWGKADQIPAIAARLRFSGLRYPIIMTDIALIPTWEKELFGWRSVGSPAENG